MKKLIQIASLFLCWSGFAQESPNPFKSIGKEVEVLTFSNGEYDEFFPNDTIQRLGTVMYNTVTMKIESFVSEEILQSESMAEGYMVSRWLSRDPLAAKYPSMSPYNFVGNMPIIAIDPDGQDIIIVLYNKEGEQRQIAVKNIEYLINVINSVDNHTELFEQEKYNLISNYVDNEKEHLYIAIGENPKEFDGSLGFTWLFKGGQVNLLLKDGIVNNPKENDPEYSGLSVFNGLNVDNTADKNAFILLNPEISEVEFLENLNNFEKKAARTLAHEIGAHVKYKNHEEWGQGEWNGSNDYGKPITEAYYINFIINMMSKDSVTKTYSSEENSDNEGTYKVTKSEENNND